MSERKSHRQLVMFTMVGSMFAMLPRKSGHAVRVRARDYQDWHKKRRQDEPECGAQQWRMPQRYVVRNICHMGDEELALRRMQSLTSPRHRSKASVVIEEFNRRKLCLTNGL